MPDMTVERTEARSLMLPKSLLAQTVEAQLLPPERFGGDQKGNILAIKKIGDAVAVVKEVDRARIVTILDSNGDMLDVTLGISSHEIADKMGSEESYMPNRPNSQYSTRLDNILTKLGYPAQKQVKIAEEWYKRVGKLFPTTEDHIEKNAVKQVPPFAVPDLQDWDIKLRQLPDGTGTFVFTSDQRVIEISTIPPHNPRFLPARKLETMQDIRTTLSGGLTLKEGGNIFMLKDSSGKELASYSGNSPKIDPADPNSLYFINTGRIYKLDLFGVSTRSSLPVVESQITIQDPRDIEFDPNGNFIIIRSDNGELSIVDKKTGELVRGFKDVRGPMLVDDQGDIIFVDTTGRLREIQTNFQSIHPGGIEAAQAKREEELKAMQERFSSLELKKVQRQKGGGITEEDVANTLRAAIARQVDEPLAQTTDPAAIEDIMDRLQGLKTDPANQAYVEVVDEFIGKAREKLSGIRTTEFNGQLGEYEKSLEGVQSVGDTIGLDEEFARLLDMRQKTDITDPATRRNIEQRLRAIQTRKDAVVGQYQNELSDAIHQAFPNIEQLIKETGSSQELAMFGTTVEAQQFEMMLANIRDPKIRKELRDRLNAVKTEQRTGLEARGRQLEEEQRLRWAQVVEEAKEDLGLLREQISELSESKEIDRFERNPLVTAWRAKIFALPPELREIEEKKLEIILGSRKKDIEHRKELGAIGDTGELKFGQVSFPVYKKAPEIWRPVLLPIKGAMYADLAFQDEQGRIWHPDPDGRTPVIPDLNNEQTIRMIERHKQRAESYFKGLKREVPDYNEKWRLPDYQMKKLEELAESINIQVSNHMGLTILEGEAGTGKNVLVDVLANLSNREVITIACNKHTAKEDLTYEFYYDPQKGTYKLPSRLVEALKRPGVVILFDEINTIEPGIIKMLNPLFDYRRKLVVNEGGVEQEITADPTTILLGTMNPQDYVGVEKLAETILSRADIIQVDYPPFEKIVGGRTHYSSDEAEMLYSYIHGLENLKQPEFKLAWNYLRNKDTTNGGDMVLKANTNLEKDINRLYDAIRVANKLRQMYQAYQIGESNEPLDFTTSLREMVNIALRMNHAQNVKDVVKRVILPKIGDRRQRVMVDQTINAVLP